MALLSFKDWYENKQKSSRSLNSDPDVSKISENIFRAPSKMLHIEIDPFLERSKSSKNKIDRFYLSGEIESYSDEDIRCVENLIKEASERGNKIYLVGYDFTSADPKKCIINSRRLVRGLRRKINCLEKIEIRSVGSFEKINENHLKFIPKSFGKRRIELIECRFEIESVKDEIELNFNFNPNDYEVLEKYKTGLKNILFQYILLKESFLMKIQVFKSLPNNEASTISEKLKNEMDLSFVQEMKYPDPSKSSIIFPENKPSITRNKITVKELTNKRASSVTDYLSKISEGMEINFISEGMGYGAGDPKLIISIQ